MPLWAIQILADSFLHFLKIPTLALVVPRYPDLVPLFSLGSLRTLLSEGWAKLPLLFFLSSLRSRAYLFIGLGFHFAHCKWALAHKLGLPYFLKVHLLWILILVIFWTQQTIIDHIMQCEKLKETTIWLPKKTNETNSFKVKNQWEFNLTYPQGKQIHYDRMEVFNRFSP